MIYRNSEERRCGIANYETFDDRACNCNRLAVDIWREPKKKEKKKGNSKGVSEYLRVQQLNCEAEYVSKGKERERQRKVQ